MPTADRPFCSLARDRVLHERETAFAIRDSFPVSHGDTFTIPWQPVSSFLDFADAERADLMSPLAAARPASYKIGSSDRAAAEQTPPHLHIQLIPRYAGDRDDPRGRVGWVLPDRAAYRIED